MQMAAYRAPNRGEPGGLLRISNSIVGEVIGALPDLSMDHLTLTQSS